MNYRSIKNSQTVHAVPVHAVGDEAHHLREHKKHHEKIGGECSKLDQEQSSLRCTGVRSCHRLLRRGNALLERIGDVDISRYKRPSSTTQPDTPLPFATSCGVMRNLYVSGGLIDAKAIWD